MYRLRDYKVVEFLESKVIKSSALNGIERKWAQAKSVSEIADAIGVPEKKVRGSLRRLKKKKLVSPNGENWQAAI
jgi:hypothetical protein